MIETDRIAHELDSECVTFQDKLRAQTHKVTVYTGAAAMLKDMLKISMGKGTTEEVLDMTRKTISARDTAAENLYQMIKAKNNRN